MIVDHIRYRGRPDAPSAAGARFPTAVCLLKILDISIECLEESEIGRWPLEVLNTMLLLICSKSRPWNLNYEHRKYENGRSLPC